MPYTYLRIALIRRTPSSSCVSFFLLLPARGRPGGNNSVSKEEHHETMRAEIDSKTVGTRLCAQRRAAYPGPRSQGTGAGAFHPLERRPLPALHCTHPHRCMRAPAVAGGGPVSPMHQCMVSISTVVTAREKRRSSLESFEYYRGGKPEEIGGEDTR